VGNPVHAGRRLIREYVHSCLKSKNEFNHQAAL
jgi:hypothetical protein